MTAFRFPFDIPKSIDSLKENYEEVALLIEGVVAGNIFFDISSESRSISIITITTYKLMVLLWTGILRSLVPRNDLTFYKELYLSILSLIYSSINIKSSNFYFSQSKSPISN